MRASPVLLAIGLVVVTVGCMDRPPNTLELRFTVRNDSPVAAQLKAVNWASGATIGTVTPALIAPRAQTQVTVDVPLGFRGWGIYVDAGNGQGMVVFTGSDVPNCSGDVPIAINVSRAGQPSWSAPHGNWCGRH